MVILSQLAIMLKLITKLEKWMVGFVFLSDWSTKLDLSSPATSSYMFPFLLGHTSMQEGEYNLHGGNVSR